MLLLGSDRRGVEEDIDEKYLRGKYEIIWIE